MNNEFWFYYSIFHTMIALVTYQYNKKIKWQGAEVPWLDWIGDVIWALIWPFVFWKGPLGAPNHGLRRRS